MDRSGISLTDQVLQDLRPEPWIDSVPSRPLFAYEPLKSERHIRVLCIRHFSKLRENNALSEGTIRRRSPRLLPYYEIIQVDMADSPIYSAVSYAWGEPERSHTIKISGAQQLQITKSLAAALHYLPSICSTELLWIDQICIDQSNLQERNHQVRVMGDIYSNASEVIIWTGEEIEDLHLVKDLAALPDAFCDNELEALSQLLRRPWFKRTWVVQEAALAKAAIVVAGSCQIPLLDLFDAWNKNGNHWTIEQMDETFDSSITLRAIGVLRGERDTAYLWEPGFEALLNHLGNTQCSDLRDHVYAFLGLQNDSRISIVPDYTLSTSQVFTATARAIIEGTNSLNIFRFLPLYENQSTEKLPLPSWVPNWSRRNYDGRVFQDPWYELGMQFNAAKDMCHRSPRTGQSWNHELIVSGQVIDRVACLLPTYRDTEQGQQRPRFFSLSDDQVMMLHKTALLDLTQSLRKRLAIVLFAGQIYAEVNTGPSRAGTLLATGQYLRLYDDKTNNLLEWSGFLTRRKRLRGYNLIYTQGEKLGLVPRLASEGDMIAILHGFGAPVVLRQSKCGTYSMIGQCYLEDAMFGEAVTWKECDANAFILV